MNSNSELKRDRLTVREMILLLADHPGDMEVRLWDWSGSEYAPRVERRVETGFYGPLGEEYVQLS